MTNPSALELLAAAQDFDKKTNGTICWQRVANLLANVAAQATSSQSLGFTRGGLFYGEKTKDPE